MNEQFLIRGKKLITVSEQKTINDGALAIRNGKIIEVGPWHHLRKKFQHWSIIHCHDNIITPSLVDCHTHLLEFAPAALFPVTQETHLLKGKDLFFEALSAGITALGEQICGHPNSHFAIKDYRKVTYELPLDISFAATSISIGFQQLAHFTALTKSLPVTKQQMLHDSIIKNMVIESDYPGENIFLNATPANFLENDVPRAGELIYSFEELKHIVKQFHALQKKIGVHVAGEEAIALALKADVDVLHHAHGITDEQIDMVASEQIPVVATPLGGTHLQPNSPEEIVKLVMKNIPVSISTDAYLPPHKEATWLPFSDRELKGPAELMLIAQPAMIRLRDRGCDENDILALITKNPAIILEKGHMFGSLATGMDANFLVANGVPGLEVTDKSNIKQVYFRGRKVIDRG